MNWYIIRHPETGGIGVISEPALRIHRAAGWIRVSGPISDMDKDHLDFEPYAEAVDLDAPKPADKPSAKTSKENT